MAIYHCSVQVISRSAGRSSVASAAYRAREKLHDERIGKTFNHQHRGGLSHAEILIPDHAPDWLKNRQKLWQAVEKIETRKNSQLAREFILALPKELSLEQNVELVRRYAKEQFVKRGMIADICIHDANKKNPHAHVMLTMRHVDENGFKSEKKSARDWNHKDILIEQRASWSKHINRALEQAHIHERVDHRSWKDKGIDRVPEIHLGWYANGLEKQGVNSEKGDFNRYVQQLNYQKKLEREIKVAQAELQQRRKIEKGQKVTEVGRKVSRIGSENIREKIDINVTRIQASNRLVQEPLKELEELEKTAENLAPKEKEKKLIKQFLDEHDRERDKSRPKGQKISGRDGNLDARLNQQVENLKSAMDDFEVKEQKKRSEPSKQSRKKRRTHKR